MARTTVATLETKVDSLIAALPDAIAQAVAAALAPAPVKAPAQAPAKAEAKSPAFGNRTFTEYVDARKAAAQPCAIHPALEVDGEIVVVCNRTFSPKSSGGTNHVARVI